MPIPHLLMLLTLAVTCMSCRSTDKTPESERSPADALAERVAHAAGRDNWHRVGRIQFTVISQRPGNPVVTVSHDWDLVAGTDTIEANNAVTVIDVRRPLNHPDAHAAIERWAGDTLVLLTPVMVTDPDAVRTHLGRQEIEGANYDVLEVRFGRAGVPDGERIRLFVDPGSSLVKYSDRVLIDGSVERTAWEDFDYFGPLLVSALRTGEGVAIRFKQISVQPRPPAG